MNHLTHLECSLCARVFDPDRLWNLCPACQKPLLARYDLAAARQSLSPELIAGRAPDMWRYSELLPVRAPENMLTLGEGFTPLMRAGRLGNAVGFERLYIKDESLNPTGSFKARGLAVAVSRARELGIKSLSIPSAGNAGGALSAYAALAGIPAFVFMPRDVPQPFVIECRLLGAQVTLVDGLITDAGRIAADQARQHGRFDISTLKEPYRLEGKKTMGYEIAEQMGWCLPDVILYPTGGGTGLVGIWKAFDELEQLGWIGQKRPRMVAVQAKGCAPIVKAFQERAEFAQPWLGAKTIADGLRVPAAIGDFLILHALSESGGTAVAVTDEEIMAAMKLIARVQGMFVCPEAAAPLAAFQHLLHEGWIRERETVVLLLTGSGLKYTHLWD